MDTVQVKDNHSSVFFTFGRFQPPTIGHSVLINQIADLALTNNADAYVFVSSKQNDIDKYKKSIKYKEMQKFKVFESTDLNQNPLSVDLKVKILKKMYPETPVRFINTMLCQCTTIFPIVDKLRSAGYTDITMVVGSDRVESFSRILPDIKLIPAGETRTVNYLNKSVKAMSGTKMREAAVAGNVVAFKAGVLMGQMTDADAMELLNAIRTALGYEAILRGARRNMRTIKIKRRRRGTYKLSLEERT